MNAEGSSGLQEESCAVKLDLMIFKGYRIRLKIVQIFILSFSVSAWAAEPQTDALSAYTNHDYKTALKLLRPMADEGNTFAEFTIGKIYTYGEGVAKDPKKGVPYIQAAADKGLAIAQYHLAQIFLYGNGVPKDTAKAALYFQKAAEQGDMDS